MRKAWKRVIAGVMATCMIMSLVTFRDTSLGSQIYAITKDIESTEFNNNGETTTEESGVAIRDEKNQETAGSKTDSKSDSKSSESEADAQTEATNEAEGGDIVSDVTDDVKPIAVTADGPVYVAEAGGIQTLINQIENETDDKTGTIKLDPAVGTYAENIIINDGVSITLDLNGCTFSPAHRESGAATINQVTVFGLFTMTDSFGGGKMDAGAEANIRGVTVASGGSFTMNGGAIENYVVTANGAGVRVEANGSFTMNGGRIANNDAGNYYGGGLYAFDIELVKLNGGSFVSNTAAYGGGISCYRASNMTAKKPFTIKNTKIIDNEAKKNGGGIYHEYGLYEILSDNTLIEGNKAASGAGMYIKGASTIVVNETAEINKNEATGNGGGIFFFSATAAEGSAFVLNGGNMSGNKATNGGAVAWNTTIGVSNVTVDLRKGILKENEAMNNGGALYLAKRTDVTVGKDVEIISNKAENSGGGIYLDSEKTTSISSFTLNGGKINKNECSNVDIADRRGAGVYIGTYAVVTLNSGQINENIGAVEGCGIRIGGSSTVEIHDGVEICSNVTRAETQSASGAGIHVGDSSTITMTGGLIEGNHSAYHNNDPSSSRTNLGAAGMRIGNYGTAYISGGKIINNISYNASGGAITNGNYLYISGDTLIAGNKTEGTGTLRGGAISGGYIYLSEQVKVEDNRSLSTGGAIDCVILSIEDDVVIQRNSGSEGGAARVTSQFIMNGGTIQNNEARTGNGGAVYLYRSQLVNTIDNATIINNQAKSNGGVFYFNNDQDSAVGPVVKITNTVISGNKAGGVGGAIYDHERTRVIIGDKTVITENEAGTNGGGIYVRERGYAKAFLDGGVNDLEILEGATVQDNVAVTGRDVYLAGAYPGDTATWARPSFKTVAAPKLGDKNKYSYWADEINLKKVVDPIDTKPEIDAKKKENVTLTFAYTYCGGYNEVAKIGRISYPSVQAAVDAIKDGTAKGNDIFLLRDNREDVVVPSGVTATFDLQGFTLSGATGSVITVEEGADFTVRDNTADSERGVKGTGQIKDGRGTKDRTSATATSTFGGGVFVKGTFTLEEGSICDNRGVYGAAVYVANGGTFNMTGGTIEDNKPGTKNYVIYVYYNGQNTAGLNGGATFTMTGGEICNNQGRTIAASGYTSNITIEGTKDAPIKIHDNVSESDGTVIYTNAADTVQIKNAEIYNNTAKNASGIIYISDAKIKVNITDSEVYDNVANNGGAIYNNAGNLTLDGAKIYDNTAVTGNGGGIYANGSANSKMTIISAEIHDNSAMMASKDIYLGNSSIWYKDDKQSVDTRTAKAMNLDHIDAWYDADKDIYYVAAADVPETSVYDIRDIVTMFNSNDNYSRVSNEKFLVAAELPTDSNIVARVIKKGDTTGVGYTTLGAAIAAAAKIKGEVTVLLLADVTESVVVQTSEAVITMDMNGHSVTAPKNAPSIFSVNGGNMTITDLSDGGGGELLPPKADDISTTRAIYLNYGNLTIENIKISGFKFDGNGAAIYQNKGATVNKVNYDSILTINSGEFSGNQATKGGAIYVQALDTTNYNQKFIVNGGVFKNNRTVDAGEGGALYINHSNGALDKAEAIITGGIFEDNYSDGAGGAIYVTGSNSANQVDKIEMYGFIARNNEAKTTGGAISISYASGMEDAPYTIGKPGVNTEIYNNKANTSAGSIHINSGRVDQYVLVQNVDLHDNISVSDYGGMYILCAHAILRDSKIYDNKSGVSRGGVSFISCDGLIDNIEVYNNEANGANAGGGLYVQYNDKLENQELIVQNSHIYNNTAYRGGGIWVSSSAIDGTMKFINNEIDHNKAIYENGGGVLLNSTGVGKDRKIIFEKCNIHDNTARQNGAGMYSYQGGNFDVTIKDCIIEKNNTQTGAGGGIHISAYWYSNVSYPYKVHMEGDTIVRENIAATQGGGIYFGNSEVEIKEGVTISNNIALGNAGGGIYYTSTDLHDAWTLKIDGAIIKDNTSSSSGGGIFYNSTNQKGSPSLLIGTEGDARTTITGNKGVEGGGIYVTSATNVSTTDRFGPIVTLKNVLLEGNEATKNGGGYYQHYFCDQTTIGEGAVITGNIAALYGGGVYESTYMDDIKLVKGGKIYGNEAALGQDVFAEYNSTHRLAHLNLIRANQMFSDTDPYHGSNWLDEEKSRVYTNQDIIFNPASKRYALTLNYATNKIVAVVDGKAYHSVQEAVQAIYDQADKSGTIYMVDDSTECVSIPIGVDIKLNLNGYTLQGSGTSAISCQGNLEIVDEKQSVDAIDDNGQNKTYESGDGDGTITGSAAESGGGISVEGGTVTLSSGKIAECIAGGNTDTETYGGGAVAITAGEFVMKGGKICDNKAVNGAAILVKSTAAKFSMYDGEIYNNTALNPSNDTKGYGVINNNGGNVNIYGGRIHDNKAAFGGAIYNRKGNVNISQSNDIIPVLIDNNEALRKGGAIYIAGGTVTVGKSTISENKTTMAKAAGVIKAEDLSLSSGGGIYIHDKGAVLNITPGAMITKNEAVRGGGIYQYNGTVNILGGTITKNVAQLGGGVAQNPLPGDANEKMTISSGAVYDNVSTETGAGNDIYSAFEGSEDYYDFVGKRQNVPKLNVIAAIDMGNKNYNVWKDDTYDGDKRVGTFITDGQYITARIVESNNLQLTADYYDTEIIRTIDTGAFMTDFKIQRTEDKVGPDGTNYKEVMDGQKDGTKPFDNGDKISDGIYYNKASLVERTAKDFYDKGQAEQLDETYTYNGVTYHYISYQGKKYEQDQMVVWSPGDDYSETNNLVRTNDDITYGISATVQADGTGEEKEHYTYHVWVEGVIQATKEEAEFSGLSDWESYAITSEMRDGKQVQVLRGYKKYETDLDIDQFTTNVGVKVHAMANGDTIKPEFKLWVEGNDYSINHPAEAVAKTMTISASPKYNVVLNYNSDLAYTSYFDMTKNAELSEKEAKNNPNAITGTILGYGVTVELYNEPTDKGLKGVEIPTGDIEFDLRFKGKVNAEKVLDEDAQLSIAPYIWAFKESNKEKTGRALGSAVDDTNMNWNDEDDLEKHSYYTYDAAPYNKGSDETSCYNGGGWTVSGSQPSATDEETVVHVKVQSYAIDTSSNPSKNADEQIDNNLNSAGIKAFSAGYIQVLFPLDLDEEALRGFIQINMDAAVTNFHATSLSGMTPDEMNNLSLVQSEEAKKEDLGSLNHYFGYPDNELDKLTTDGYATNEARYIDNFVKQIATTRIEKGGDGSSMTKDNQMLDQGGGKYLTNSTGNGDTPLGSVIYIEGSATYSSQEYHPDDPEDPRYREFDKLYDTQYYTNSEFNYVTALNILQKFDADVYTPIGTDAIINKKYDLKSNSNNIDGGAFVIKNGENASDIVGNNPFSYNLTILYAAKPDGQNWKPEDNSAYYGKPEGTYNDGGVAQMDLYREENLLYFETLDDLHAYFGGEGKCVAILYEFRNCCFRTGRTVYARSKMNVTEDFKYTGETYCTTNDVRAWTTYRPHYKRYYAQNELDKHLYSFYIGEEDTLLSSKEKNGITPYGLGLDAGVTYSMNEDIQTLYTEDGKYNPDHNLTYDNYRKTEYEYGSQVEGSHNGSSLGNSLLLYTIDTSIQIEGADHDKDSNAYKSDYYITKGERTATFDIMPKISISSAAKKNKLVANGSQKADITIKVELSKYLAYQPGSVTFDYSKCDYEQSDLEWDISTETDDNGIEYVILKTYVSDVERGLPRINIATDIGDAMNPANDPENGTTHPIKATIYAEYEELGVTAAQTKSASTSIKVLKEGSDGISKKVSKRLVEIGEDFDYLLIYSNRTENATPTIDIVDVFPYNGDGRGTEFSGGYRIKKFKIEFTDKVSYDNFLAGGQFSYAEHQTYSSEVSDTKELMDKMLVTDENPEGTALGTPLVYSSKDDSTYTIEYDVTDLELIQYATDTSAYAIFAHVPELAGKSGAKITVTATPRGTDMELLKSTIKDKADTQIGDCIYYNRFAYRNVGTDPGPSLPVYVKSFERTISGTVFMDMNQDGTYYSKELEKFYENDLDHPEMMVEYPLKNITAHLYYAKIGESDQGELVYLNEPNLDVKVMDVLGNPVDPVQTDENGDYIFHNLAADNYVVVFTDGNYDYMTPDRNAEEGENYQPLPFERLSVTTLDKKGMINGNRGEEIYADYDSNILDHAITYRVIEMPNKEVIETNPCHSPNWNLGLYYIDMNLKKQWQRMVKGVPDGTEITFKINGIATDTMTDNKEEVYGGTCTLSMQDDGSVKGRYLENYRGQDYQGADGIERDVEVIETQDPDNPYTYNWTLKDNIYLQAETGLGDIDYVLSEDNVKNAAKEDVKEYYKVSTSEEIDPLTQQVTREVVNSQILGSATIVKESGAGQALPGAKFSIYAESEAMAADDHSFYSSVEGTTGKDARLNANNLAKAQTSSETFSKIVVGGQDVIDGLKEKGTYNEANNLLTVGDTEYLLHRELVDSVGDGQSEKTIQYYYYVKGTVKNTPQVAVVVFDELPLYDENGPIYYTIRETGVKNGYVALADFHDVTKMNLFDGYEDSDTVTGYVRDVAVTIVNTRGMALPVTGGSGMSFLIILGTMMMMLGGAWVVTSSVSRKRRRDGT